MQPAGSQRSLLRSLLAFGRGAPAATVPRTAAKSSGSSSKEDGTRERIVAGARNQAEAFGLRRFTIDDVARHLGLSRVTIYRYFPKKERLVEAMLVGELRRFLADLEAALVRYGTLEELVVEGVSRAIVTLREHALLNRVLRTEPDVILPHLTRDAGPVLAMAREFIARYPRREIERGRLSMSDEQVGVISEVLARLVLSFVLTPASIHPLDSPADVRRFTQTYLAPVVRAIEGKSPPAKRRKRAAKRR